VNVIARICPEFGTNTVRKRKNTDCRTRKRKIAVGRKEKGKRRADLKRVACLQSLRELLVRVLGQPDCDVKWGPPEDQSKKNCWEGCDGESQKPAPLGKARLQEEMTGAGKKGEGGGRDH